MITDENYYLSIQKGTTISDRKELPLLICCCVIMQSYRERTYAYSSTVLLPKDIKTLVVKKNIPLYTAYEMVFGSDLEITPSICEILTGKQESVWMAESVFQAFSPFNNKKYFKV